MSVVMFSIEWCDVLFLFWNRVVHRECASTLQEVVSSDSSCRTFDQAQGQGGGRYGEDEVSLECWQTQVVSDERPIHPFTPVHQPLSGLQCRRFAHPVGGSAPSDRVTQVPPTSFMALLAARALGFKRRMSNLEAVSGFANTKLPQVAP